MKNQYEQHLNAAALQEMGVPTVKSLKPKYEPIITDWLHHGETVAVNYPDQTQQIINQLVADYKSGINTAWNIDQQFDLKSPF